MSVGHYENFPVGSLVLPQRLRRPIHIIYQFARTADDIADEGEIDSQQRLQDLDNLQAELDLIANGEIPKTVMMQALQKDVIKKFNIPLQLFYDLLSAFKQDVVKKRYAHFGELVDYCRRSANPIGRMILHLYGETNPRSLAQSDGICTALQLINFWQDVAIDWQKERIYFPQEDLVKYGVSETQIAQGQVNKDFQRLMDYECHKAFNMLKAGAPLGKTLKGRMGFELRMIILGAQCILQKLEHCQYDIFHHRPKLNWKDWIKITKRAVMKK